MSKKLTLAQSIAKDLPRCMHLPDAIQKLFDWIEEQNFVISNEYYDILGCLTDPSEDSWIYDVAWTEVSPHMIQQFASLLKIHLIKSVMKNYLKKKLSNYIYGGDGSHVAFWVDEEREQKIVHIGSGSGSILLCVLAENPVGFIRLISIGYEEICWLDNIEALKRPSSFPSILGGNAYESLN